MKNSTNNLDATNVQNQPTPTFEQAINSALADLTHQQRLLDAEKFVQAKCSRFNLWSANTKACAQQIKTAIPLYTTDAGDFIDWVSDIATPLVETVHTEQARAMNEKFEQWRRHRETIAMPIKHILGKCKRMGVADSTLGEITNDTWTLIWNWIAEGEARTKQETRRRNGRSLTHGVSIWDVVACSCTTPDCRCPCTCGLRNPQTGKGCQCSHSIKKWLYKLASYAAESWKYEHEPKSNPTSLDATAGDTMEFNSGPRMGSSGSYMDLDGVDVMAREDYEASQAELYLEEHEELPTEAAAEPDLHESLMAAEAGRSLKTGQPERKAKAGPKTMWTAAPSLLSGKRAQYFMRAHAEHATDESRAILESWRHNLAVPVLDLRKNPEQWNEWMKNQGVFAGGVDDLSGYIPPDTLADLKRKSS